MEFSDKKVFHAANLSSVCFNTFEEMRLKNQCCDYLIYLGNSAISAHRVVLAAAIPYFRERFVNTGLVDHREKITLEYLDHNAVKNLIDFAYTHTVEVTPSNVMPLFTVAHKFGVAEVQEACIQYLVNRLEAGNAIATWNFAHKFNCSELKEKVDNYIKQNFDAVTDTEDSLNATEEYLNELISKDDLQTSSEEKVYEFVIKWVRKMPSERIRTLPDLLCKIRIELLTPKYLSENIFSEELMKLWWGHQEFLSRIRTHCSTRVNNGGNYSASRSQLKPLIKEEKSFNNGISPPGLYLISAMSSLVVQYLDPQKGKWVTTKTPHNVIDLGTATEVSGMLCFIDRGLINVYDAKNHSWSGDFGLFPPRPFLNATSLNNMIYSCGGSDNDVEMNSVQCWNLQNMEYYTVSSPWTRRNFCGIVALNEYIYIVGGKYGLDVYDSVEKYDSHTNHWTVMSPMLTKRCDLGCTTMNGKIYVCGGTASTYDKDTLSSAEVYDPETDRWEYIAPMKRARHCCQLLSYGGKLYAIGGNNKKAKRLHTVEVYDPQKDEWEFGPPIDRRYSHVKGASVYQ